MKYPKSGFKLGVCALALGLSGWANGACLIGADTNAASVQSDSGNGTYNCTVVSTENGALSTITNGVTWSLNQDGTVNWKADTNADGYPTVDVDLVSVSSNSGKRCNYSYPRQRAGGKGLSTSDLSPAKSVTFCTDGNIAPAPLPEPPEPFSTTKDGCSATFANAGTGTNFDVAIGYTKNYDGIFEGAAICAGSGQNECINECVPHTPAPGTVCAADANGKLPLECRACEYDYADPDSSLKDLKYCWFYENHVDTLAGTFKPSPKKKSLSAQIDVTTGSDCYTVTVGPMYGGRTYSYQQCP